MIIIYTYNSVLEKRKSLLLEYCKSQKEYRNKKIISNLFYVVAGVMVLSTIIFMVSFRNVFLALDDPVATMIFFSFPLFIFCLIPFLFGSLFNKKALFDGGFPYSQQANTMLIINDDRLEFVHWIVGITEPASRSSKRAVYRDEDKYSFIIDRNNIESIKFSDLHECFIIGDGKLVQPDWACMYEDLSDKTLDKREFEFLLTFNEDIETILMKWWNNNL